MSDKPHIVRVGLIRPENVLTPPRARSSAPSSIRHQEIGVEFVDQEFIPYADLGYNSDIGFFACRKPSTFERSCAFAAAGRLIDPGGIVVTTGLPPFDQRRNRRFAWSVTSLVIMEN